MSRFLVLLLRLMTAAVLLVAGAWMIAGLAELFGLSWPDLPLRAPNEGLFTALFAMGALVVAVASVCFFLWEQIWNRRRPGGTTAPALYLSIFSILLLQLALLFRAESVYDHLWKTFK